MELTTDRDYKNTVVKENAWRQDTEAVNRKAEKAYLSIVYGVFRKYL